MSAYSNTLVNGFTDNSLSANMLELAAFHKPSLVQIVFGIAQLFAAFVFLSSRLALTGFAHTHKHNDITRPQPWPRPDYRPERPPVENDRRPAQHIKFP